MKLKINKACDLSSISVLPPRSKGMNSGTDGSGLGRIQGSQLRSQSQQSFGLRSRSCLKARWRRI